MECTLNLAGVEVQLRDDDRTRSLGLYLGPIVFGLLTREGEVTMNLMLREVRVSDGEYGEWLNTRGHPDWLTAHLRIIDAVSPRYNGVANIVKLSLGTMTLFVVPPSITNALNLVETVALPSSTAPRDASTVPKQSRATSPSQLSSKVRR